ncbi:hypothetical protein ACQEV4_27565 [Streptomyces shenzhenensis]|uniref:hypothetical protein n=1 Tax=Streptomyces shenzhenensis TaxID=943815 RepID=UPI003D8E81F8
MAHDVDFLLKATTPDTAAHVHANRLVAAVAAGEAGAAEVARVVVGEYHAHTAEVAAFATLAARHPQRPVADYFLDLARLVLDCEPPLLACASALGRRADEIRGERPPAGMRAFGSLMGWLAMRAGPAEAACAIRADLLLWCGVCSALTDALRASDSPLPEPVTDYFELFRSAPDRFVDGAREVAAFGLAHGESPAMVEYAVAQVEPVLAGFWSAALEPTARASR